MKHWHRPGRTPTPIIRSILESGIENMEIYRAGNRMFMLIEASDSYSPEAKARADAANPDVQRWIARMKQFQQPVPAAGPRWHVDRNGAGFSPHRSFGPLNCPDDHFLDAGFSGSRPPAFAAFPV